MEEQHVYVNESVLWSVCIFEQFINLNIFVKGNQNVIKKKLILQCYIYSLSF